MKLTSIAFQNKDKIPKKYGYNNGNVSPPFTITDIPDTTKSLILIMDDPDALPAVGKVWVHWVLFNIPPETKNIFENVIPKNSLEGINDFGEIGYGGPAPPDKEHLYIFKLYAIDQILELKQGVKKNEIESMIQSSIIEEALLTGKYHPQ